MSQQADSYKLVDIPLSQVNHNLKACPKCTKTRVTLEGDFMRHFVEEFENGESLHIELYEGCKHVTRLGCHHCHVIYQLIPDEVFNQKAELIRVKTEQAERDARLVQPNTTIVQ